MRHKCSYTGLQGFCIVFLLVLKIGIANGQIVNVVNIIPNVMSNETNRDSEPSIAINPVRPSEMVVSAFTPDPAGSGNGPVFYSTDGGNTWDISVILPGGNRTRDITLRFGKKSSVLYAAILRGDNANLNILRTIDFSAGGLMTILVNRENIDQPYIEASLLPGLAAIDRVYIGNNDFAVFSGQTATVDLSLDAATDPAPSGFGPVRIETRATANQDGPSVRPAIHSDGVIYVAYFGWRVRGAATATSDVVVVRDDNWGAGASPFTDLLDPVDGLAGIRIVTGVTIPVGAQLGTQRIGSSLSIAVDPSDSRIVYIAWADGANVYTIHVRRSLDKGATWSPDDLRMVTNATNPHLAINSDGKVAFLYQQLVPLFFGGNNWQTHVEISNNGFVRFEDFVLANVPDNNGAYIFSNPIGDYAGLMAVGRDFYGVFSGNNTPNRANFPNGINYQRNANFAAGTLLQNDNVTAVAVSIDPFFFSVEEPRFEYAAKCVCGDQNDTEELRLAKGRYSSTINIHNPDHDASARFDKTLVLTFPPSVQEAGEVIPIGTDALGPGEALKVDCEEIKNRFFPAGFPNSYIEGFIEIQSQRSLNVTAVYTASNLGGFFSSSKVRSIDVEQIIEREKRPLVDLIQDLPDLPDLIIAPYPDGSFGRIESRAPGETFFKFNLKVRNIGVRGCGPFVVELFVERAAGVVATDTYTFSGLTENEEREITFEIELSLGGRWFNITVDANDEVEESDETNNSVTTDRSGMPVM